MKKYLVVDEHEKTKKAKQSIIKLENFKKYIKTVFFNLLDQNLTKTWPIHYFWRKWSSKNRLFSNKKEAKANALTPYVPKSFPFLLSD